MSVKKVIGWGLISGAIGLILVAMGISLAELLVSALLAAAIIIGIELVID